MKKIILMNGPPRSGKDTLCTFIGREFNRNGTTFRHMKFAEPLYEIAKLLGAVDGNFINGLEKNNLKNEPLEEFYGYSLRGFLIGISENYLKPMLGKGYAGEVLKRRIGQTTCEYILVSDLGFKEELDILVNHFGQDNVFVVRVERKGCSFVGDSRSYVEYPNTLVVENNSNDLINVRDLAEQIISVITHERKV